MRQKLSEMSLNELWQLFPIFLTQPNSRWKGYYAEMRALLQRQLATCHVTRISHIGSTAVENLWAKPIVDMLVELPGDEEMNTVARLIIESGFTKMSESRNRMSFNRGYTENGFAEKVYHLHLRYAGDHDELYFRDYLRDHPEIAKEYERLKLRLWPMYEHNRDAYTEAKTEFINQYTELAKKLYGNRYP